MTQKLILSDYSSRLNTKDKISGLTYGEVEIQVRDAKTKETIDKQYSKNLIVYDGREILAQLIDGKDRITGSGEKDWRIYWMSFGEGGVDPTQPFIPIAPNSTDTGLQQEIVIDPNNSAYADGGKKKPILSAGKSFLTDSVNDNRYLILKRTVLLGKDEANGKNISEAGLWFAPSENSSETNFKLASRFTFKAIPKTNSIEILFIWFWFV